MKSYGEELRWLVVYKRLVLLQSWCAVQADLGGLCCRNTQRLILNRFASHRDVAVEQGSRAGPPHNQILDLAMDTFLLEDLVKHPSLTYFERKLRLKEV